MLVGRHLDSLVLSPASIGRPPPGARRNPGLFGGFDRSWECALLASSGALDDVNPPLPYVVRPPTIWLPCIAPVPAPIPTVAIRFSKPCDNVSSLRGGPGRTSSSALAWAGLDRRKNPPRFSRDDGVRLLALPGRHSRKPPLFDNPRPAGVPLATRRRRTQRNGGSLPWRRSGPPPYARTLTHLRKANPTQPSFHFIK